ncbi:MAG: hypothetical protein U0235_19225 [Polyangiaceae bacterium]
MNVRNAWLVVPLLASLFATAACVRVPGEVEATFAPHEPGEPSNFHHGARRPAPAPAAPAAASVPAVDAGLGPSSPSAPLAPAPSATPAPAGGAA